MESFTITTNPASNEVDLIQRSKNGDRHAFSELVCIHADGVRNVIYRMCGDVEIAEDGAQETFIRAWLNLGSFRPQTSFRNWLYRIAVNAATDMLRKDKHILPNDLEDFSLNDPQPGPEAASLQKEHTALIRKAVLSLPDACRTVLILREYESLHYDEIADTLNIPVGTVMSRLNYARKLLREKLKQNLYLQSEVEHV